MTAGMRRRRGALWPRPAGPRNAENTALKATDFIVFTIASAAYPPGALTGAPAFKFKQRSDRRITMDSLDRFAQKPATDSVVIFTPLNRRAEDSISCNNSSIADFRNLSMPIFVEDGVGNAGQHLLGPLGLSSAGAVVSVPAVSVRSSTSSASLPRISPMTAMDSTSLALLRRLATMASPASSTCE
jgi:hypothetical protein